MFFAKFKFYKYTILSEEGLYISGEGGGWPLGGGDEKGERIKEENFKNTGEKVLKIQKNFNQSPIVFFCNIHGNSIEVI